MAIKTGIGGGLSLGGEAVSTLAEWAINSTSANVGHSAGNASGGQVVLPGVRDWTGTASLYGESPLNAQGDQLVPGTSYAFIGYSGSGRDTGTVILTELGVSCDIKGGGWLTGNIAFAGDGALTHTTGSAVSDASAVAALSSLGCKAMWQPVVDGTVGTDADIPNVTGWTLRISRAVKGIVTATGQPWTTRFANSGPITANLTVNFADSDHVRLTTAATRMTPGAFGKLKLYTSATRYWLFNQVCVDSINGIGAKTETGDYEELQLSATWTSHANVSGTMTIGSILNPAGDTVWG